MHFNATVICINVEDINNGSVRIEHFKNNHKMIEIIIENHRKIEVIKQQEWFGNSGNDKIKLRWGDIFNWEDFTK